MALVPDEIDAFCEARTTSLGPVFDDLKMTTQTRTELPQMQVGRVEGRLLHMLVALSGARRVVEVGTFTGYSALAMAAALPEGGEVATHDVDEETTQIALEHWAMSDYGDKIRLVLGDARETLKEVGAGVDLAFIDADKESYEHYFELLLPKMRVGGLMVFDNALWSGTVLAPQTPDAQAIRALVDRVDREPSVENVLLPVRDGMLLARKVQA